MVKLGGTEILLDMQKKYEPLINDQKIVPLEAILEKSENFKSTCSGN